MPRILFVIGIPNIRTQSRSTQYLSMEVKLENDTQLIKLCGIHDLFTSYSVLCDCSRRKPPGIGMRAIIRPCRTPKRRAARVDIRRFHNCKWTITPTNRSRCYVGLLHDGQFLTQKRGGIGRVSLDVENTRSSNFLLGRVKAEASNPFFLG